MSECASLFHQAASAAVGRLGKEFFECPPLTLSAGQCIAILGANGSGKSTLLETWMGWLPPIHGPAPKFSASWSYLPQITEPLPALTVRDVVAVGARGERLSARVDAALRSLNLTEFDRQRADLLSGGQQQAVRIARTLVHATANKASVLMLDEPCASTDVGMTATVMHAVAAHCAAGGAAVFTTHHAHEAKSFATDALLVRRGETARFGSVSERLALPELEWLYGVALRSVDAVVAAD